MQAQPPKLSNSKFLPPIFSFDETSSLLTFKLDTLGTKTGEFLALLVLLTLQQIGEMVINITNVIAV